MEINTIKTLNFLDALRHLQQEECIRLRMDNPGRGSSFTLPDGSERIHDVLWNLAIENRWGNSQFTNDSIQRYAFPTFNGEPFVNEQEERFYRLCEELGVLDNEMVILDVSW